MNEYEKYQQIKKEAFWTGVVLAVLIVFWWLAGFGLASAETKIFGLPLWTLTSTFGVWAFSLLLVKLLTAAVFKDMSFDKEADK